MKAPGLEICVLDAHLLVTAGEPEQLPPPQGPELCVLGRSNVGKSSLINLLLGRRDLARTSRTPGRTRVINFFGVQARLDRGSGHELTVVDLPGYGYAKMSQAERRRVERLLAAYLDDAGRASGALLLVDGRHPPAASDIEIYAGLVARACPVVVAATKIDAVAKARRAAARALIGRTLEGARVVVTSARSRLGRQELWHAVWHLVGGAEV